MAISSTGGLAESDIWAVSSPDLARCDSSTVIFCWPSPVTFEITGRASSLLNDGRKVSAESVAGSATFLRLMVTLLEDSGVGLLLFALSVGVLGVHGSSIFSAEGVPVFLDCSPMIIVLVLDLLTADLSSADIFPDVDAPGLADADADTDADVDADGGGDAEPEVRRLLRAERSLSSKGFGRVDGGSGEGAWLWSGSLGEAVAATFPVGLAG